MEDLASEVLRQCAVATQTVVVYGPVGAETWPHTHADYRFVRNRMRVLLSPRPRYVVERTTWVSETENDSHPSDCVWTALITLHDAGVALELLGRRLRIYCNDQYVTHTTDRGLILRVLASLA